MDDRQQVLAYHEASKHRFSRFAAGPDRLDWATQPDPFLRYRGAPRIPLEPSPPTDEPRYDTAFVAGEVAPRPLDRASISQLFVDSLALSAWKQAGPQRWSLRVNPSSGNLHPTEGYLVCGPVDGLSTAPLVAHFAPAELALELRAHFELSLWHELATAMPPGTIFVGLTSIHWREAWKYGERAFRYCQHDVGHAIGAITMAAAGLGWRATLLDELGTEQVASLLGVRGRTGPEAEVADCVLALDPDARGRSEPPRTIAAAPAVFERFDRLRWLGEPSALSPDHVEWPAIERVEAATVRPPPSAADPVPPPYRRSIPPMQPEDEPIPLRRIIRQRRSAVALDGHTGITRDGFFQILRRTIPRRGQYPFNAIPWAPCVDLVVFVHRVADLTPGLYCLVRDPSREAALRDAMRPELWWTKPPECPEDLALFCLREGDARAVSARLSCHQAIAADGCFSLGMLATLDASLQSRGPWFYRRLFWECGVVGQVLYLEAEAFGIRGTGIGCFFDDGVHDLLGLTDQRFQSLYHFTMGGPVDDPRLRTLAAYTGLDGERDPPYAYLPGGSAERPRPPRSTAASSTEPLDPSRWHEHAGYRRGLTLFDRGYYWEAHEAFEALWIAAGRSGPVAELLQGLIQLAAAAVKVRQGRPQGASRFGTKAGRHFARARDEHGESELAGLRLDELAAFADEIHRRAHDLPGSPELAVEIVFDRQLRARRDRGGPGWG